MNSDPRAFIPALEPAGLPAPPGVFVVLLNATLVLHFLTMGYVLTVALLQTVWTAAARPGSTAEWMLRRTQPPLPLALSFTITFGVAPLLFVQVLYQPVFYPANILIGYRWMGIVPALMAAFYLIYVLEGADAARSSGARVARTAGRAAIAAALLYTMTTLTLNALTMLRPDRWRAIEAGESLAEPVFVPRLLHNLLAALIIGSVWLLTLGTRSARHGPSDRDREGGRALARLGALVGVCGVMLQMIVGVWLLVAERPEVRAMLFGGRPAALLWLASLLFVLGLAVAFMAAVVVERSRALAGAAWVCLVTVLAGMFAAREAARQVRLAPWLRLEDWTVHPQPAAMAATAGALAVGGAALALVWRMQRGR